MKKVRTRAACKVCARGHTKALGGELEPLHFSIRHSARTYLRRCDTIRHQQAGRKAEQPAHATQLLRCGGAGADTCCLRRKRVRHTQQLGEAYETIGRGIQNNWARYTKQLDEAQQSTGRGIWTPSEGAVAQAACHFWPWKRQSAAPDGESGREGGAGAHRGRVGVSGRAAAWQSCSRGPKA